MVGTFALDRITAHANQVGRRRCWSTPRPAVAVDKPAAPGRRVQGDRDDAPELFDVRRFRNDWEKHASLQVRLGNADAIDAYIDHDRVAGGEHDEMLDTVTRRKPEICAREGRRRC